MINNAGMASFSTSCVSVWKLYKALRWPLAPEQLAPLPSSSSSHYQKPSISRLTFLASDFKSRPFEERPPTLHFSPSMKPKRVLH